jgi:hypothetical protein
VIVAFRRILHDRFLMMEMGPLHFFLGLKIIQDALGIKLYQAKYVKLEDGGDTALFERTL